MWGVIKQKFKRAWLRNRLSSYSLISDSLHQHSPYSNELYENLLVNIKSSHSYELLKFDEQVNPSRSNFIFRHDLDTLKCLQNFHFLADINLKHDVPLSVFIRMDDEDYLSEDSYKFVSNYLNKFQFGLHSSCYAQDNSLEFLKKEIVKFNDIFGFKPKYITLHGLGVFRYQQRLELIDQMENSYKDYGFVFADFLSSLRSYSYVIQDCHLENGLRFIKKDAVILPPAVNGSCYLFLCHPCYWG